MAVGELVLAGAGGVVASEVMAATKEKDRSEYDLLCEIRDNLIGIRAYNERERERTETIQTLAANGATVVSEWIPHSPFRVTTLIVCINAAPPSVGDDSNWFLQVGTRRYPFLSQLGIVAVPFPIYINGGMNVSVVGQPDVYVIAHVFGYYERTGTLDRIKE